MRRKIVTKQLRNRIIESCMNNVEAVMAGFLKNFISTFPHGKCVVLNRHDHCCNKFVTLSAARLSRSGVHTRGTCE